VWKELQTHILTQHTQRLENCCSWNVVVTASVNDLLCVHFRVQFMGHMDVISFISDGFNIYFPIAIVLLCILTWFSVGQRVLHLVGFQQFIGDDDMTQELIDEGAQLVSRGNAVCVTLNFLCLSNDHLHSLPFVITVLNDDNEWICGAHH